MNYTFKKANISEIPVIWEILQQAIQKRKLEGSNQWQDGYPNPEVLKRDIEKKVGFVLTENETIVGYVAMLVNDEPEYENIEGQWITHKDYVVFHRVAISENHLGKGLAKKMMNFIESYALENHIYSIKADTNHDNDEMIAIFKKLGYQYCGTVCFRNSFRNAYEKVLEF
ncbi:GNAT family N-acetyltransferase [Wenyingzhuangia sp. 2_MG-2023]|uniref:GNAT family N-acetyltransferase n=1 Tax=Wenyingzhuangia sp. 2_MG-2023 TaxID=3062639 RepID=UPI0026E28859|nr:GNAT family N-acetyltransferase [Wenyingzhuangia sp. 2_MG-2023]MDO6736785.1 GNAT family N-acetyltransferase [Wenyingzhuangia sp. 2_MG-2023]